VPRILRTIIPRIRRSLRDRGLITSLSRSILLPLHLLREYRSARSLRKTSRASDFDLHHGLATDGDYSGRTYLSDLNISGHNWIDAVDYIPIEPQRFRYLMASLPIPFAEYTFIDFGSGKGRALLLASEFPFKRIMGVEFSPELHQIAQQNIARYRSGAQKCRTIDPLLADFTQFPLPAGPLLMFFFDPCSAAILNQTLANIERSLQSDPRPACIAYVAIRPEHDAIFAASHRWREMLRDSQYRFVVFQFER
jgi:SAM-dependent methyltransferase